MKRNPFFLLFVLLAVPAVFPRAAASSASLRGQAALQGDVSAAAPPVWTETPEEDTPRRTSRSPQPLRFFGQLDFWTKDGAYGEDQEAAVGFGVAVLSAGYDSAAVDVAFSGGIGARVGLFKPGLVAGLDVGGSVGYVLGPSMDTEVIGHSVGQGDGKFRDELETDFFRVLVEAMKELPVSRRFRLRLRGGAGLAAGRINATDRSSGSFVTFLGLPDSAVFDHRWTGFTWEFIPSVVFKGDALDVEVGVGTAAFPTMKETGEFYEFRWRPVGLRLGLEFS